MCWLFSAACAVGIKSVIIIIIIMALDCYKPARSRRKKSLNNREKKDESDTVHQKKESLLINVF